MAPAVKQSGPDEDLIRPAQHTAYPAIPQDGPGVKVTWPAEEIAAIADSDDKRARPAGGGLAPGGTARGQDGLPVVQKLEAAAPADTGDETPARFQETLSGPDVKLTRPVEEQAASQGTQQEAMGGLTPGGAAHWQFCHPVVLYFDLTADDDDDGSDCDSDLTVVGDEEDGEIGEGPGPKGSERPHRSGVAERRAAAGERPDASKRLVGERIHRDGSPKRRDSRSPERPLGYQSLETRDRSQDLESTPDFFPDADFARARRAPAAARAGRSCPAVARAGSTERPPGRGGKATRNAELARGSPQGCGRGHGGQRPPAAARAGSSERPPGGGASRGGEELTLDARGSWEADRRNRSKDLAVSLACSPAPEANRPASSERPPGSGASHGGDERTEGERVGWEAQTRDRSKDLEVSPTFPPAPDANRPESSERPPGSGASKGGEELISAENWATRTERPPGCGAEERENSNRSDGPKEPKQRAPLPKRHGRDVPPTHSGPVLGGTGGGELKSSDDLRGSRGRLYPRFEGIREGPKSLDVSPSSCVCTTGRVAIGITGVDVHSASADSQQRRAASHSAERRRAGSSATHLSSRGAGSAGIQLCRAATDGSVRRRAGASAVSLSARGERFGWDGGLRGTALAPHPSCPNVGEVSRSSV